MPGSIALVRSQGIQNAILQGNGQKKGINRRLQPADGTGTVNPPIEKFQFFYHGDHLGSSSYITDDAGAVYQHLEYFPYGETWVEDGGTGQMPYYRFTGKELDPETGLYYYGARYYDPVLSRWISSDPMLGGFLPNLLDKKQREKNWQPEINLSGMGGVYNPTNLVMYAYSNNNPLKYIDPNGKEVTIGGILKGVGGILKGAIDWVIGEDFGAAWRSAITEKWERGPTGGYLPQSITEGLWKIARRVPADAAANGMHAWHAGSNAYLAKKFGLIGAPLIFLAGVIHETPLDWHSFWAEQRDQGTVNHLLDSVTDIVANVFGLILGYFLPHDMAVDRAIRWGNYIPGPGEPDPTFGGRGGKYKGNPSDAWGQYPNN